MKSENLFLANLILMFAGERVFKFGIFSVAIWYLRTVLEKIKIYNKTCYLWTLVVVFKNHFRRKVVTKFSLFIIHYFPLGLRQP